MFAFRAEASYTSQTILEDYSLFRLAGTMDNSPDSNTSREKIEASHLEKTGGTIDVSSPLDDGVVVTEYDEKEVKKILRRIDWRLLPVLTILYLLAFIGACQITP